MYRTLLLILLASLVTFPLPCEAGGFSFVTGKSMIKKSDVIVAGTLTRLRFLGEARRKVDQVGHMVTYNNVGRLNVTSVIMGDAKVEPSLRLLIETECFEYNGKTKGIKRYVNLVNAEKEPEVGDYGIWYLKKAGKGYNLQFFENPESSSCILRTNIKDTTFTDKDGFDYSLAGVTFNKVHIEVEETLKGLKKARKRSKKTAKRMEEVKGRFSDLEKEVKNYFEKGFFGHPNYVPAPNMNRYKPESLEEFRNRMIGKTIRKILQVEARLNVSGQIIPKK